MLPLIGPSAKRQKSLLESSPFGGFLKLPLLRSLKPPRGSSLLMSRARVRAGHFKWSKKSSGDAGVLVLFVLENSFN